LIIAYPWEFLTQPQVEKCCLTLKIIDIYRQPSLYTVFLSAISHIGMQKNWLFSGTYPLIYGDLRSFLYANSLYASLFLESLSLVYNEVHLYKCVLIIQCGENHLFRNLQNLVLTSFANFNCFLMKSHRTYVILIQNISFWELTMNLPSYFLLGIIWNSILKLSVKLVL